MKKTSKHSTFQNSIISFLQQYGQSGLEQAMQRYIQSQHIYVVQNKFSASKIYIDDIYYLTIEKHLISIHTADHIYQKYGTLKNELQFLAPHNFMKCNQSCIVSLEKIHNIQINNIILIDNRKLHLSRKFASKVISRFILQKNH